MLPLENLDKKIFKEILNESKKNIHRFTTEWTDENYHDPGITFLEMFSWLTEMQRYFINKIPNNNHYKFLKLYDVEMSKQGVASTYVSFHNVNKKKYLAIGTKLLAEEQVFEIQKTLMLTDNILEKILTFDNGEFLDNTYLNFNNKTMNYYCFGKEVKRKNKLFLGFSKNFELGETLDLTFNLYSDYEIPLIGENKFSYGIKGKWYVCDHNNLWQEIMCLTDDTQFFTKTGVVTLKITTDMKRTIIDRTQDSDYYWIMFQVDEEAACVSPKVDSILLNSAVAVNIDQKAMVKDLELNNGKVEIQEYLSIYGANVVQYYSDGYWIDLEEDNYNATVDMEWQKITLSFKNNYEKLRIISYENVFKESAMIGSGTGTPNQSYNFNFQNFIPEFLIIQVGKMVDGKLVWKDFYYEPNMISLTPKDCVFTYNFEEKVIVFGDGERGRVPYNMDNNLRVVSIAFTNKERGNVKHSEIDGFVYEDPRLREIEVTNVISAEGGNKELSIEDRKKEVIKDFSKIYRAVTLEDYEILVKSIQGIRIAASKAILKKNCENTVSVVVVPYMEAEKPRADAKLLDIVRTYLEDYRLITTRVEVINPIYIDISVKCIIVTDDADSFDKNLIINQINEYLTPIKEGKVNLNYQIGSIVNIGEIFKIISGYSKVKYIKKLWLDGKGEEFYQDKNGNLILPENGISWCSKIELELTD